MSMENGRSPGGEEHRKRKKPPGVGKPGFGAEGKVVRGATGKERKTPEPFDPQRFAGGVVERLSQKPEEQPTSAFVVDALQQVPQDQLPQTVTALVHKTLPSHEPRSANPAVAELFKIAARMRDTEREPGDDEPGIVELHRAHDKAQKDWKYASEYTNYRRVIEQDGGNITALRRDWEEIPPTDRQPDDDVLQATGRLVRSIKTNIVKARQFKGLVKDIVSIDLPTPPIMDPQYLGELSDKTQEITDQFAPDMKPVIRDLHEDIRTIATLHPNTLAKAIMTYATSEEEKEEIRTSKEKILEAADMVAVMTNFANSEDQTFRAWADTKTWTDMQQVRNVPSHKIIIEGALCDDDTSGLLGDTHTKLYETIHNASLVVIFGDRVPPQEKPAEQA